MMPLPTHLQGLVVPLDDSPNEDPLEANVRCTCGSESFELLYPGATTPHNDSVIPVDLEKGGHFFFRIEAVCKRCCACHLLFDADFHGWNGYICHDDTQASLPRPPLMAWTCLRCAATPHVARILIQTEGQADFVENTNGEFPPDRWPDGFGWFSMSIACESCQFKTDTWVDYETM